MSFPERMETDRLVLRRLREQDREEYVRIWLEPAVRAALPRRGARPSQGAARFAFHLDHWQLYGFGRMAAITRSEEQFIGWIGPAHPTHRPELADEIELGWTLSSSFWGKGLATEGARAAAAAALTHLDVDRVISLIDPRNTPSVRVAEKLGMRASDRTVPSIDGSGTVAVYVVTAVALRTAANS